MNKKINLSMFYTTRYRICIAITGVFLVLISILSKFLFIFILSFLVLFLFAIFIPLLQIKINNIAKTIHINNETFSMIGPKTTKDFSFNKIELVNIDAIWSALPNDKRGDFTIKIKTGEDIFSYNADCYNGVLDFILILKSKNIPIYYNTDKTKQYFES